MVVADEPVIAGKSRSGSFRNQLSSFTVVLKLRNTSQEAEMVSSPQSI